MIKDEPQSFCIFWGFRNIRHPPSNTALPIAFCSQSTPLLRIAWRTTRSPQLPTRAPSRHSASKSPSLIWSACRRSSNSAPLAGASFENSPPDGSRNLGVPREWLAQAKHSWETTFDWRAHEDRLNTFAHFQTAVPLSRSATSLNIHFVVLFSRHPLATPLVLLHGWPGSFLEFLPLLALLRAKYPDPAGLPYHVIVPSLPGFAFSDAFPADQHHGNEDVAQVLDHLMTRTLGFGGYAAQGGDVGSRVGRIMAARHEGCVGALLNYSPVPRPEGADLDALSEDEKAGLERGEWFRSSGSSYALMQATRPGTVGLVLGSSPLALLAWIGEKFLDWTDPRSFPDDAVLASGRGYSARLMDEILVGVSLYWLTGRAHSGFYSYREVYAMAGPPPKSHASPEYHIHAPKKLGFSNFPLDVAPTPRKWIESTGNLVFWAAHEKGGHFAALEQPAALLEDLEKFVTEYLV
ncbi:Alpha/Beta hydrolase protein [Lasiosphaeria hispida]|uniref:Alpha/Beta hydrolase protein n=1 Tax=Lasiosphaeria hispida TaxID=260671 RepID=A0AAJ0H555_9PEZI|nr:Alpha/Beta hydrolase protein [Lasiosphaeria hispida]